MLTVAKIFEFRLDGRLVLKSRKLFGQKTLRTKIVREPSSALSVHFANMHVGSKKASFFGLLKNSSRAFAPPVNRTRRSISEKHTNRRLVLIVPIKIFKAAILSRCILAFKEKFKL